MSTVATQLVSVESRKADNHYNVTYTFNASKPPLSLAGHIKRRSNGEDAKTAPVQVVAYSGDIVYFEDIGATVFDLDSMSSKAKIPLDYCHSWQDSIGYLNKVDVLDGALVCSGAIVPYENDIGAEIIAKMSEGVPYEASIEAWDYSLELIPEGMAVTVNGKQFEGPLCVVRNWNLKAVAICKFGRDSDTSALLASADKKSATPIKGIIQRLTKYKGMTMTETETKTETVDVVTAPVANAEAVATEVEVKETEAKVEAESTAVETDEPTTETDEVAEPEAALAASAKVVAAIKAEVADPRAEAKRFLATFGDVAGAKYFAEGKQFDEALVAHLKSQQEQLNELNKRLAAVDRGASKPVAFSDSETRDKPKANNSLEAMTEIIRSAKGKKAK